DAPILDERRRTKSMGTEGDRPSNIASQLRMQQGDVDAGFAQADIVIEREFTTRMVHQGYIEPQNGAAMWNPDDTLTVWTSTQGSFNVRTQLMEYLKLPAHKIKVVPMEIGGGFGGKIPVYLEPLAALLSKKTGKPVKLTMSRTEVFEATGPTSGSYMRAKIGATREGKLVAAEAYLAFEAGAFPGSHVGAGAMTLFGPYEIPNMRV